MASSPVEASRRLGGHHNFALSSVGFSSLPDGDLRRAVRVNVARSQQAKAVIKLCQIGSTQCSVSPRRSPSSILLQNVSFVSAGVALKPSILHIILAGSFTQVLDSKSPPHNQVTNEACFLRRRRSGIGRVKLSLIIVGPVVPVTVKGCTVLQCTTHP